jgi:hypothetical protein
VQRADAPPGALHGARQQRDGRHVQEYCHLRTRRARDQPCSLGVAGPAAASGRLCQGRRPASTAAGVLRLRLPRASAPGSSPAMPPPSPPRVAAECQAHLRGSRHLCQEWPPGTRLTWEADAISARCPSRPKPVTSVQAVAPCAASTPAAGPAPTRRRERAWVSPEVHPTRQPAALSTRSARAGAQSSQLRRLTPRASRLPSSPGELPSRRRAAFP